MSRGNIWTQLYRFGHMTTTCFFPPMGQLSLLSLSSVSVAVPYTFNTLSICCCAVAAAIVVVTAAIIANESSVVDHCFLAMDIRDLLRGVGFGDRFATHIPRGEACRRRRRVLRPGESIYARMRLLIWSKFGLHVHERKHTHTHIRKQSHMFVVRSEVIQYVPWPSCIFASGLFSQPLRIFRRARVSNLDLRTKDCGRQGLAANCLYAACKCAHGKAASLEFLTFLGSHANYLFKSELLLWMFDSSRCSLSQADSNPKSAMILAQQIDIAAECKAMQSKASQMFPGQSTLCMNLKVNVTGHVAPMRRRSTCEIVM